jgi:hypothetical protein
LFRAFYKNDQKFAFKNLPVIAFQEGGSLSTTLLQVTVQVISDFLCNNAYAAFGGITARMICAGVPGGGRDACQVTGS